MPESLQQRSRQQIGLAEDKRLFLRSALRRLLLHPDPQDLFRVIPFVERCRHVKTFVALQADKLGIQSSRKRLGNFSFADSGMSFHQQRAMQSNGEENRRSYFAVTDIVTPRQQRLDV